jgi:hypothetical protein
MIYVLVERGTGFAVMLNGRKYKIDACQTRPAAPEAAGCFCPPAQGPAFARGAPPPPRAGAPLGNFFVTSNAADFLREEGR